ncbi:hypothetical protein F4780DRAFT_793578 [Xylariomycetidae sp. FL0641]|nr:hypothetical protein F4780DRAFT_793578 [Xylariomycetidae sp. FL0641]
MSARLRQIFKNITPRDDSIEEYGDVQEDDASVSDDAAPEDPPPQRKRGRPRKDKQHVPAPAGQNMNDEQSAPGEAPQPRERRLASAIAREATRISEQKWKGHLPQRAAPRVVCNVLMGLWEESTSDPFEETPFGRTGLALDIPAYVTAQNLRDLLEKDLDLSLLDKLFNLITSALKQYWTAKKAEARQAAVAADAPKPASGLPLQPVKNDDNFNNVAAPSAGSSDAGTTASSDPPFDPKKTADELMKSAFLAHHPLDGLKVPAWHVEVPTGVDYSKDIFAEIAVSKKHLGTDLNVDSRNQTIGLKLSTYLTGTSDHFADENAYRWALGRFWYAYRVLQEWIITMRNHEKVIPLAPWLRERQRREDAGKRKECITKALSVVDKQQFIKRVNPSNYESLQKLKPQHRTEPEGHLPGGQSRKDKQGLGLGQPEAQGQGPRQRRQTPPAPDNVRVASVKDDPPKPPNVQKQAQQLGTPSLSTLIKSASDRMRHGDKKDASHDECAAFLQHEVICKMAILGFTREHLNSAVSECYSTLANWDPENVDKALRWQKHWLDLILDPQWQPIARVTHEKGALTLRLKSGVMAPTDTGALARDVPTAAAEGSKLPRKRSMAEATLADVGSTGFADGDDNPLGESPREKLVHTKKKMRAAKTEAAGTTLS